MKKIFLIIGIIILAAIVGIFLAKDMIAKTAVTTGVKLVTGLKLDIASLKVGLFKTMIDIKQLKVFNPQGFPDKLMLDMPEIYVDYDLMAFLKRTVHLPEVRINLKEFVIVKNSKGEVNLDSLKAIQESKKKEEPGIKEEMLPFKIDVLELKVGKVIYKDYSKGGKPKITETDLNLNERFKNITDPYAVTSIIVFKSLMNTTVGRLVNFDLGPLQKNLGGTLSGAAKVTKDAATRAVETGGKVIGGTADRLKNLLPFDKKQ